MQSRACHFQEGISSGAAVSLRLISILGLCRKGCPSCALAVWVAVDNPHSWIDYVVTIW